MSSSRRRQQCPETASADTRWIGAGGWFEAQKKRVQVMRKGRYLFGATVVVTAILAIGGGLEVHLALARPTLEHPGFERPIFEHRNLQRSNLERPAFKPTPVDRTMKGDRGPGLRGEHPSQQLRLPDGCEPRFSFTNKTSANEVARRCVT
ncbi:MAG TPA: hypothetical protein VK148_26330 [Xanthobacteraceae bacterium]|jgi:hypothetical protein|nr:hypothetical protein [Xanthobacteraceae bacterium]